MSSETLFLAAGGALLLVLLVALLVWRTRSVRSLNRRPPAPPAQPDPERLSRQVTASAPSFEDLFPGDATRGSFSSQLQTDRYNLRIESVGGQTNFIANGVAYASLADIPDDELRLLAQKLHDKSFRAGPLLGGENETLRQVVVGNQSTIEIRSSNGNLSIQRQGGQTRYIANGLTYEKLSDIPDDQLRQAAKDLVDKMV